ncbi:MAG: hypothetical protein KBC47_05245 [Candidatus Peribacteraceae bacterium]|nr:hypothetical protein [Candidatus Peribacteraceae bacterium]
MPTHTVDSIRISSSLAVRQLLSEDIIGEIPHTDQLSFSVFHSAFASETPVRIMAFGGAAREFPFLKTSMVLTAMVTMYALQFLYPVTPTDVVASNQEVAMFAPAGWKVSNYPALLPAEQRRFDRVERLHSAAEDAANASASSEDTESSVASQSTESSAASEEQSSASSEASSSVAPEVIIRGDNKRGVFLTAGSVAREQFFNETVEKLLASGGDTIVMDVKGGGALFHSAAPMAKELALVRDLYDLPAIIEKLHEKNIYVIGRFVAIKDEAYVQKKPDTRIKHPVTGKVLNQTWIDPANDEAIQYNMEIMCEIAAAGIDEINLDYIRFSTAEFGALGVFTGEQKADRVEKFIKASRDTIDRCGPKTKLGLSTYAILGWNYDANVRTLGQDVVRFAPLVDIISPMAYPATFTSAGYYIPGKNPGPRMYWLVYRTLTGYAELLGPEESKKIRPWIQGYGVVNKDMSDQMRAVYDAGFCGFQVWNAGNNYGPTYVGLTNDVNRPDRCIDPPLL